MSEDEPITDLDLMAYADGLFVADCARRRRVEQHLAECREDAERVSDYGAQNAAIRAAYQHLVYERVPERIECMFAAPQRSGLIASLCRAAAVIGIAIAAATAGWHASDTFENDAATAADRLVNLAVRHASEPSLALAAASSEADARPLQEANARLIIELLPPDLSAQHLRLAKFDRVRDRSGSAMRLSYIDEEGKAVNLFLRPSRQLKPPQIRVEEEEGMAVASWQNGPFTVALTAEGKGTDLAKLATAVRTAIGESMSPALRGLRVAGSPAPAPRSRQNTGVPENRQPSGGVPVGTQLPKVN